VMMIASVGTLAIDHWYHPGQSTGGGLVFLYYLLFLAVDYAAAWLAFRLEPAEDRKLLIWLFLQRFCYRQLLYFVAVKATLAALRGAAVGWGTLQRKATVQT